MVHGKFKRTPSTQDITWFIQQYRNKTLDLEPPYQRRSVWTTKDRVFFLDTIFKGYPCPAIYLHKTLADDGTATYHVVDGKQRLETILKFVSGKIRLSKDFDEKNPDLAGKLWKDINIEYKKNFWNYILPVDQFDVVEENIIDEMFDRLNRNSRKLEQQELRHAKYDGWFATLAESLSINFKILTDLKIVTVARARRMKDVQFISELLMVIIKGNVNGFSQDMITQYYAFYDDVEKDDDIEIENDEEFNPYKLMYIEPETIESVFYDTILLIRNMNNINSCVIEHAKSYGHFYSLFAFVYMNYNEIYGEYEGVANKYLEFMNLVKKYVENPQDENIIKEEDVIKYAVNSTGASTDLPRRTARVEALKNYCL
ncbi:DUF262 domain-containing protein [Aliarcobacter butzleri]|uniref:DUF262 domain-containing protein n=1 Tax=Aliarcobacter butzleri TaxID=28197 RepID=UPI0021B23E49|nr:DUF262 domain-containing protein [Aliarcobacter butzleri]MCT7616643.1 DUF262 domain-containing protein [Aliarcobacter butzleri]MDN5087100.1 DUF262 domain-containing protein [Aliarcobacter butzleri]